MTARVPQGSILGLLLYFIYVNDVKYVSDIFHPILFADDTTLISTLCAFTSPNNTMNTSNNINGELKRVNEWLCANKLAVNTKKTKFMIFHHRQRRNIPSLKLMMNGKTRGKILVRF